MKQKNSSLKTQQGHNYVKHMAMMAICCALPIAGFLTIAALGINAPSLETLIALICPLGMVAMMYMMFRDHKNEGNEHSCCKNEEASNHNDQPESASTSTSGNDLNDQPQIQGSGSFKA